MLVAVGDAWVVIAEIAKAGFDTFPVFNFQVPKGIEGVDSNILNPRNTWADKAAYDATAKKLAGLFRDNFTKYADGASAEVRAAGPAAS